MPLYTKAKQNRWHEIEMVALLCGLVWSLSIEDRAGGVRLCSHEMNPWDKECGIGGKERTKTKTASEDLKMEEAYQN